jgi:hypothetical protein
VRARASVLRPSAFPPDSRWARFSRQGVGKKIDFQTRMQARNVLASFGRGGKLFINPSPLPEAKLEDSFVSTFLARPWLGGERERERERERRAGARTVAARPYQDIFHGPEHTYMRTL